MLSSLTNIRISLTILLSLFYLFPPVPVFAETSGDIIADMEQASETYEQYELPEEVYEQNKIDSIDDIFTNDESESESVLDDNSVSDDVSISSDETVDNTDNVDSTDNTDNTDNTDSVDSTDNTETNEQESENTEVEQKQESNAQENNAQENTEQEQTVSVDQLYEVNTYILGILIFFLIVVVCKLVYSFFNIFF